LTGIAARVTPCLMILDYDPDSAVAPDQRIRIGDRLAGVAADEGARVLLAVESGSRAWGFHSPDSDYDVRFLYVRDLDDYLALNPPRDVIERPIVDDLDVGGWDLGKALKLAARGNAVVSEWLTSPIVYGEAAGFREAIVPVVHAWRSRYGDISHYLGLAHRQWAAYVEGRDEVRLKKYFYVLRPAACLQWLRDRGDEPMPMNLPELLAGLSLPDDTAAALTDLRIRKQAAGEGVGSGPREAAIDAYVDEMLSWAQQARSRPPPVKDEALWARTEALFRDWVKG
jgi:predicted nucleotidyltransferase